MQIFPANNVGFMQISPANNVLCVQISPMMIKRALSLTGLEQANAHEMVNTSIIINCHIPIKKVKIRRFA